MPKQLPTSVAMLLMASGALAQTFSPGDPKLLSEVSSDLAVYGSCSISDVVAGADGRRFVVGNATNPGVSDGFLMITDKRGRELRFVKIDLGTNEDARAVTLDASGNVFVACNVDGVAHLRKYSPQGDLVWTGKVKAPSVVTDVLVTSAGVPYTSGSVNTNWALHSWLPSGGDTELGVTRFIKGELRGLVQGGDKLYFAGWAQPSTIRLGTFGALDLPTNFFNAVSETSESEFNNIAFESTSQKAYAGGWVKVTGGRRAYAREFSGFYSSGNVSIFSQPMQFTFMDANRNPEVRAVLAGDSGYFYFLLATNTAYSYGQLAAYRYVPALGFNYEWDHTIYDSFANLFVSSMVKVQNGGVAVLSGTEDYGWDHWYGSYYHPYYIDTFSQAGARLHRSSLYNQDFQAYFYDMSNMKLVYGDGTVGAFGQDQHGRTSFVPASFVDGPNDVYTCDEDTTLNNFTRKAFLGINDANGDSKYRYPRIDTSTATNIKEFLYNNYGWFSVSFEPNFNGVASFKYDEMDGSTVVGQRTVTINVKPVNDPPVARNDEITVAAGSEATIISVLENDEDVDGDDLKVVDVSKPTGGSAKIPAGRKTLSYKPRLNFVGVDVVTYTIKDKKGVTATATVTITVQ